MQNITLNPHKLPEKVTSNLIENEKRQKTNSDNGKDQVEVKKGNNEQKQAPVFNDQVVKEGNNQESNNRPFIVDEKGVYKLAKGQLNIKLDLEFNEKNVRDFVNKLKQDLDSPGGIEKSGELKIVKADLKVDAQEQTTTKVSGNGRGRVRDVSVRYRRTRYSSVRYRNRQVEVALREREQVEARLDVRHRNGYRTVNKNLVQRYSQDVSLKFNSVRKFNNQVSRISRENPEAAGKYLDTTNKLVTNEKVKGETINNFFDVVEGFLNQAEKNLKKKIDEYFLNVEKNFSFDKEQLAEAKKQLYNQVNGFFKKVDKILESEEKKALETPPKELAEEIKSPE